MTAFHDGPTACPACDGAGEIERMHPRWGSPFCPEPYEVTYCRRCNGSGAA